MWRKLLSLLGLPAQTVDSPRSLVIAPWTEPDGWECEGQFDTPRRGPPVPSLRLLSASPILRRRIRSTCTHIGSYGMGGPGFLGIELDANDSRPKEWLVLCLWGAAEWCLFDGQPIESNQLSRLTAIGADAFAQAVAGGEITTAKIEDKSCELCITTAGRAAVCRLEVPSDTGKLPVYGGTGGRRMLALTDSLLDAWVLSPTEFLYV
jgi:hypothetical protein